MIKIQNKQDCCGCAACEQSCPKHCITLRPDSEGFLYPSVDGSSCIDCGLCERVCPILHPYEEHEPLRVMAAINRDKAIRESSSSGGIFYMLASRIIHEGGVVFGARFDSEWQVLMDYTETMEGIHAFMGSKYVQARTGMSYADAKRFLVEGRRVLYSGTPCQIAGLHHYLRKPYGNLLTVEVVCHGVPSPMVWQKYLAETVRDIHRITSLQFRDKREGWKRFNFVLRYDEASRTLEAHDFHGKNLFMRAFLSNLILRPSCEYCKAKRGRSRADISLADYWGVQLFHPEMDDDRGTSLVLANTEKGRDILEILDFQFVLSTYANALKSNGGLSTHAVFHPKRERFFAELQDSESLAALVNGLLRPTFKQQARMALSKSKHLVIKLLNNVTGGGKSDCSRTQYITYSNLPTSTLSLGGIKSVSFRDKSVGWKRYGMRIELEVIDLT